MQLLPQFKTNDDGSKVLKQATCDVCDTKRECYVDPQEYERYMCPSCVSGRAREAVAQEWESEGNTHMAYMTRNY